MRNSKEPNMWLENLTLDTVIVHTVSGQSFKGLKAAVHDDCLVLRESMLLEESGSNLLNGEVVVPREQVSFMQLVEATV